MLEANLVPRALFPGFGGPKPGKSALGTRLVRSRLIGTWWHYIEHHNILRNKQEIDNKPVPGVQTVERGNATFCPPSPLEFLLPSVGWGGGGYGYFLEPQIPKCLYSYRDDPSKKVFKITAEEQKQSTSGWRASRKNVVKICSRPTGCKANMTRMGCGKCLKNYNVMTAYARLIFLLRCGTCSM